MGKVARFSVVVLGALLLTQVAGTVNAADDAPFVDRWMESTFLPPQGPQLFLPVRPANDSFEASDRSRRYWNRPLDFSVIRYETPVTIGRRDVLFRVKLLSKRSTLVKFQLRF